MHRVLLVERSATLRLLLAKLLKGNGYEVVVADSFEVGLRELQDDARGAHRYAAAVIEWPTHTHVSADELFSLLEGSRHRELPALILTQEAEPATRTWVARRAHTALVLWDNYAETIDSLSKLLAIPQDAPLAVLPEFRSASIRILFVDDSPSVRVYFRRLLSSQGYVVETAASVDEGLKLARRTTFDIAIIDYFMPGANGDVLCRQLHEDPATAGITTAVITGTYLDEVIKDSLQAGAVECMFKNEADELFLARIAAMARAVQVHKSVVAEQQRLVGILGSVGDGVYGVDNRGRMTFINPAARRILGYSEAAPLTGESPHALFHFAGEDGAPRPPEKCFLHKAYVAGQELPVWETVFWQAGGKPIPVEGAVHPLSIDGRQDGSVVAFRDISERKSLEEKLRWQATHDPLTELLNRRFFEAQLDEECHRLKRGRGHSALLYIDLDRFKYINDTAGHAAGDQLLIEVGRQLRSRLRETDLLARLGGDEFAVILRHIEPENIYPAADSYRETLARATFNYGGKDYKVNCSIGVAVISRETQSPGEVLANADIACHLAKRKGRNQTHLYVPESDEKSAMDSDLGWSVRLREALQKGLFVLHYQPIVPMPDLDMSRLPAEDGMLWTELVDTLPGRAHYEVLVRMLGPSGEIIAPQAFIPTAERFNLMPEIDRWVVTSAIRRLGEINANGDRVAFTINLSGQTLDDKRLVPLIKKLIGGMSLDPGALVFEITETAAIENIDIAKKIIDELRVLGCRFALDDFGSGFSSFSHLKHLAVDYIKIDGLFVQGMARDPIDHAMVASMNDIAHSLGRLTIAEYVENAEILSLLKKCGVDYVQGYYLSRPLAEVNVGRQTTVAASATTPAG